jgi:hypothetical protein
MRDLTPNRIIDRNHYMISFVSHVSNRYLLSKQEDRSHRDEQYVNSDSKDTAEQYEYFASDRHFTSIMLLYESSNLYETRFQRRIAVARLIDVKLDK